jgi:CHAT domain-containing protein
LRAQFGALAARNADIRGLGGVVVGASRPGLSEIRQSLHPDEVLLEYLVTPEQLLIFVVTPSGVNAHAVDERAGNLTSRVQLARELLRQRDAGDEARGVLRALYDIMLGPVMRDSAMRGARRLIVVPHGVLTYLPLAALRDGASYVAERFEILHLPTSAALPALRAASSPVRAARAGVFAPNPRALPATRREAEVVGDMLGGDTYVGARATEARFRGALQRGGVVHVATHATLNSRNPLFSRIELAETRSGASSDNGRLEAHELLGLRIDASLVFLSGCETAIGGAWSTRFDAGEDYAALAQTFLYAGARNVVATLWRIDDVGAAEFARHFYEALGGAGYAEAIARAQRRMIADPRYRSPYFWAAFQVSGGGQAPPAANPAAVSDKR